MTSPLPYPTVEDERFTGWYRPEGWRVESLSSCRGCHLVIGWARTRSGRLAPIDRDGLNHFATCTQAEHFRAKHR